MQSRLLGVLIVLLSLGQLAKADSFGFSLGVSLQNTCMPGSVVSIDAVLMNTGSAPIVFAPKGSHSGSVPFASVDGEGQWSILGSGFSYSDFNSQFAGVTVDPGHTFQFSYGTFKAPMNQPLGASATPQLNFGIDFTDLIKGNLLGICPEACGFNNTPHPTFTLGNSSSTSDPTFFQGYVVDRNPVSVPEPFPWEFVYMTFAALGMALLYRYNYRPRLALTK
ncbi:MAG TPA: hypothetical protein VIW67_21915 [Terriglobales bacterium]